MESGELRIRSEILRKCVLSEVGGYRSFRNEQARSLRYTIEKNANPQVSHSPKSSSFRNLSSNGVRYKFREREKVKSSVPTKSDAKKITTRRLRIWRRVAVLSRIRTAPKLPFDRDLVEVERNILRYARSCSSKSAACVYGRRLRYSLQITIG